MEISSLDQRVRELAAAALAGDTDEALARRKIAWEMFVSSEAQRAAQKYLRANPFARHLAEDIERLCEVYIFSSVTGTYGTDPATGAALGMADDSGPFARMCKDGPKFDLEACVSGNSPQGWIRRILPPVIRTSIVPHLMTANGYVNPADPNPDLSAEDGRGSVFEMAPGMATDSAEQEVLHEGSMRAYSDSDLARVESEVFDESDEHKSLVYGRTVRTDILGVPALTRPIDAALRRRLLAEVQADPMAAWRSFENPTVSDLGALWAAWGAEAHESLIRSNYGEQYAHVLMVEALTDLPRPSTAVIKGVEYRLVGILGEHDVPPEVVKVIVTQFFADEYSATSFKNRRSKNGAEMNVLPYSWTTFARTLRVPADVLPSDMVPMREALFGIIGESIEREKERVARKNADRRALREKRRAEFVA